MRKQTVGKLEAELTVKQSSIHGKGVFAVEDILKGKTICKRLRTKPAEELGTYVLFLGDGKFVEVQGKLKYVNHSENPNVCFYQDLSVDVLRHIYPGEELTHNYGTNPDF